MRMHAFTLAVVLWAGPALAQTRPSPQNDTVGPPPVAAGKAPPTPAPSPPAAPDTAAPAQPVTIRLAAAPAQAQAVTLQVQQPAPPPQTVTLNLVPSAPAAPAPPAAPAAAVPATVAAEVRYPGPVRHAIGNVGEWLSRQKMARVYVPVARADVQVVPAAAAVRVAVPAAADVLPVLASPQAPAKCRLFRFGH